MLQKLKKVIKKHGIVKVANDLGYKSTSTISYWIINGEIPRLALDKVKDYLTKKED
jgi:hypothetical protein